MKKLVKRQLACLALICGANCVQAEEWQYQVGFGVAAEKSHWQQLDTVTGIMPIFSAEYGRWSFGANGLVSYSWLDTEDFGLSTGLSFRDDGYDSDVFTNKKSKALVFEGYNSPDTETTFTVDAHWQFLNVNLEQDISGKSKGFTASIGAELPLLQIDREFMLSANAQVTYGSKDYSNYVFGIAGTQVDETKGRGAYSLSSTINYSVGLSAHYVIDKDWTAIAGVEYTKLDSDIKNSPLVEKDYNASIFFGAIYSF